MTEPRTPESTAAAGPSDTAGGDADRGALGPVRSRRPLHLHPGFLALVVAGGVAGTLARYGLSIALPAPAGWPLPTLVINLAGAFLLGVLLESLARSGPDAGRLRVIRLLAGTGFMGAFTTYSTLALESNVLLAAGRSLDALGYLTASLVGGFLATFAGIRVASARRAADPAGPADVRQPQQQGIPK